MARHPLRITPLGGFGEIGRSMLVLEYDQDIIVIDAGVMFPEEEMLGVDLVIPDITYLLERKDHVRGIFITHGHEDHTGALPYILPQLPVPVYASRLAHGLISVKLKEHRVRHQELHVVEPGEELTIGAFRIEFFRMNHSIPDNLGFGIHTPVGTIVHTGDFKFDLTPVDGKPTDFNRLARFGEEGVLLLFADSTYVERPGYTPSERVVGENLERYIAAAPGRVIITTFASLIARIQQVIDAASRHGRTVFIVGRSMVDNVDMALKLGYIKAPPGALGKIHELNRYRANQVVIMTTGSQGEPTSALARMAAGEHRHVRITPGDTVIISATPIPGNESLVSRTIDNLFRLGADVLYTRIADVHVQGHASQEELKLLQALLKPRFFVPVHGEYRHLVLHAKLAHTMGVPEDNIFILEDGHVLEVDETHGRVVSREPASYVYVDGLGVGDVTHVVLRDRHLLSQDGVVVVIVTVDKNTGRVLGVPDVISRGFIREEDEEDMLEETRRLVIQNLDHGAAHPAEWGLVNAKVRDTLSQYFYQQTKRQPMILPVTVEV